MAKKLAQIGLLVFGFVVLPALGNLEALAYSKLWILVAIGAAGTVFNPGYSAVALGPEGDRGTCVQIVWSVYLCQFAAVLEALYLRYPESFAWTPLSVAALALALIGLLLRSWAVHVLGADFTMHVMTREGQAVVERGPYRFVRHPSYTGALLSYLFLPLFLGAYFAAALSALALAVAYYRRIPLEEQALLEALGEPYADYMRRVGMLVPKLGRTERKERVA